MAGTYFVDEILSLTDRDLHAKRNLCRLKQKETIDNSVEDEFLRNIFGDLQSAKEDCEDGLRLTDRLNATQDQVEIKQDAIIHLLASLRLLVNLIERIEKFLNPSSLTSHGVESYHSKLTPRSKGEVRSSSSQLLSDHGHQKSFEDRSSRGACQSPLHVLTCNLEQPQSEMEAKTSDDHDISEPVLTIEAGRVEDHNVNHDDLIKDEEDGEHDNIIRIEMRSDIDLDRLTGHSKVDQTTCDEEDHDDPGGSDDFDNRRLLSDDVASLEVRARRATSRQRQFECVTCCQNFETATQLRLHAAQLDHSAKSRRRKPPRKLPPLRTSDQNDGQTEPPPPAAAPEQQQPLTHKCEFCGQGMATASRLEQHRRVHTGERPFQCRQCFKLFAQKGSLVRHQRVHLSLKPFQCDQCFQTFSRALYLREHVASHIGEVLYKCDICQQGFQRSYKLWRHRQDVHKEKREKKILHCQDCGKSYTSYCGLYLHRQRKHPATPRFQCELCEQGFNLKADLTAHVRMHTGEKPFQCDLCNKKFLTRVKLRRHSRTHVDVKAFQCGQCAKLFSCRRYLDAHMHVHNVDKFKCDQCDRSYSLATSLSKHRKTHLVADA